MTKYSSLASSTIGASSIAAVEQPLLQITHHFQPHTQSYVLLLLQLLSGRGSPQRDPNVRDGMPSVPGNAAASAP
jgi:hypothetical protein